MKRSIAVAVLGLCVLTIPVLALDTAVADQEYVPTFREWVDVYLHTVVAHYDTEGWDIRVFPDNDGGDPKWSVVLVYEDGVDAETLVYAMRYLDTREVLVREAVKRWQDRGYAIAMDDFAFSTFNTKKGIVEVP